MNTTICDAFAVIASNLDCRGWSVTPDFLSPEDVRALAQESRAAWDEGEFRRAGVGRGVARVIREDIRRDLVMWLQSGEVTPAQQGYLDSLECLRLAINSHLFLGLFDFEGHFAIYPEGAFYQAHLDRHRGTADRLVTAILYLNEDWQPGDGGELKLWTTAGEKDGPFQIIEPRLGTLVTFMAGDYWHEVLPAKRTRMSITGWFRLRGA